MTSKEFQQWFDHFAAAFPAVQDFVRKSDPTGRATLTLWFEVLCKRDLADALAVTIGLFDGALESIHGTERGYPDWSSVPRHVSRLCAERNKIVPEWKREAERPVIKGGIIKSDAPMAAAFDKALKILAESGTMDDVRAMLRGEFPDYAAPPYSERDEYQET